MFFLSKKIKQQITSLINKENRFQSIPILGLCPLLVSTSSLSNGLGFGLLITVVLVFTNLLVSSFRKCIPPQFRTPTYIIINFFVISIIQIITNHFINSLYQSFGITIPFISATNCLIIRRCEVFAIKNTPLLSVLDGLITGIKIIYIALILGSIREIIGNGTLFDGINIIFGKWAQFLYIKIIKTNMPFTLLILPSGGFISLGIILGLKNFFRK